MYNGVNNFKYILSFFLKKNSEQISVLGIKWKDEKLANKTKLSRGGARTTLASWRTAAFEGKNRFSDVLFLKYCLDLKIRFHRPALV